MNAIRMAGIALIVCGFLGLAYGGFTYSRKTHEAKIGPLVLSVVDKETLSVPVWVGVGGIALGALLLVLGGRRS